MVGGQVNPLITIIIDTTNNNNYYDKHSLLGETMALHKFAPCKYLANMKILRSKYMAKMVNSKVCIPKNRGCQYK